MTKTLRNRHLPATIIFFSNHVDSHNNLLTGAAKLFTLPMLLPAICKKLMVPHNIFDTNRSHGRDSLSEEANEGKQVANYVCSAVVYN